MGGFSKGRQEILPNNAKIEKNLVPLFAFHTLKSYHIAANNSTPLFAPNGAFGAMPHTPLNAALGGIRELS